MGSEHDDSVRLRARIAQLESQLAREREAARRYQEALVRVARMTPGPGDVGFQEFYADLSTIAAATLAVERASVWMLTEDHSALQCVELYQAGQRAHSNGAILAAKDYPRYFAALESGRAIDAHDACEDPRTSEFRDGYLRPLGISSMLDAAIRNEGRVVGVVCQEHVGPIRTWTLEEVEFAGALADQVAIAVAVGERRKAAAEAESARRELRVTRELSALDELTSLYNRREMERLLAEDLARARRQERPLSVAMLDLDHFKRVNDMYGHPVGDQVLRELGGILMNTLRASDRPARYGGEEFLLILPDTRGPDLAALLGRVRAAVEEHTFVVRHGATRLELRLTLSIGAASFPEHGDTADALIEASDKALYQAKAAGRNRVVQAG